MPLLWISICFVTGILLGDLLPGMPFTLRGVWLGAAGVSLLLWLPIRRLPEYPKFFGVLRALATANARLRIPPLVLLACLCFGAARIGWHGPDRMPEHIAHLNDLGEARLIGVVSADPDRRDRSTMLRVTVENAEPGADGGLPNDSASGTALVLLLGDAGYAYGDRLLLTGEPVTPPEAEDFSYRDYLARQGVYTYLTYPIIRRLDSGAGSPILSAIYRLRQAAFSKIYDLFPAPEAPLLAGILLGLDNDMPEHLERAFQDTGTAHVIAISGFNIAILAGLFSSLFGKILSRWWALVLSILAIAAYTILVGGTPSVVRAAIMGSLALLAHQIGRRSAGLNTLAITAAVMCAQNPLLPWDASFQLSFGATLGLIVYGSRFQGGFERLLERRLPAATARKIAGPVGEYVLMTLAAQAMTLPVILYHFQRLSISSLLANPLILPPQPLLMVLSGIAVIAGLISDPLGHLLAALALPLSTYTVQMVELLAELPGGAVSLDELSLGTVLVMYALVLAPLLGERFSRQYKTLVQPALLLSVTGLAAAVLWRGVLAAPDGYLRLTVYDMGGAQAVLINGPGGETLLINGGPSARLLNDAVGRRQSPFDRQIDALLINAPQASAFSGLGTLMERYPARSAYWGCQIPNSRTADRLMETLNGQEVPVHLLSAGEALRFGDVVAEVLLQHAEGSALLVRWKNFRVLLPGGMPPAEFRDVALAQGSVLVLEPRHLKEIPVEDWLTLAPLASVATLDEGAVAPQADNLLVTRLEGWISITTDGERMWIEKK